MITSTANTQVKELVKLMKKSRARDEAQVFLIEGPRMAGELVSDLGWRTKIEKIYLCQKANKLSTLFLLMRHRTNDALLHIHRNFSYPTANPRPHHLPSY